MCSLITACDQILEVVVLIKTFKIQHESFIKEINYLIENTKCKEKHFYVLYFVFAAFKLMDELKKIESKLNFIVKEAKLELNTIIDSSINDITEFIVSFIKEIKKSLITNKYIDVRSLVYLQEVLLISAIGLQPAQLIDRQFIEKETNCRMNYIDSPLESPNLTSDMLCQRIDNIKEELVKAFETVKVKHNAKIEQLNLARNNLVNKTEAVFIDVDGMLKCCGYGNSPDGVYFELNSVYLKIEKCKALLTNPDTKIESTTENDKFVLDETNNSEIQIHETNDWDHVDNWNKKLVISKQLYDKFTSEWRRVHRSFLIGKNPVFLDSNHADYNYEEDMEWYRDHLNYMTSMEDYEPYKAETRQDSAVPCHAHVGPWTGPYRDLAKDFSIRAQYSVLYEKELESIEQLEKEENNQQSENKRRKQDCF